MKVLCKNEELCIACGLCEETCSQAYFKEKNRDKSSIQVEGEGVASINVCTQCGVCIDICPVKALNRNKTGVVTLKKRDCVGCFMCVGFCPEEAMRQHDDYIEPFKCIACGLCAKNCPTDAIYIADIEGEKLEKADEIAAARE